MCLLGHRAHGGDLWASDPLALGSAPCQPALTACAAKVCLPLRPCQLTLQPMGWGPHLLCQGQPRAMRLQEAPPARCEKAPGQPIRQALPFLYTLPSRIPGGRSPSSQSPGGSPEAPLGPLPLTSPRPSAPLLSYPPPPPCLSCPFLSMRVTSLAPVPPGCQLRPCPTAQSL